MDQYANPARWPFFDVKTPRPIIAERRELATGDRAFPRLIDSTIRVLAKSPSQITITYLPGTRPDDGKWKKISYHARVGDSFYDGKYSDLGIIITNPLEIYENDSQEVKDALHKFCKLEGWMEFFEDDDRANLVTKAPTPLDSVAPLAGALPSIEVSPASGVPVADGVPAANDVPAAEATAAMEAIALTKESTVIETTTSSEASEQTSNDGEVSSRDDAGEAQVVVNGIHTAHD
ncbi:hypothetical protein H2200_007075 [Cladophialophora chaetospira]|uniref:Uncharacterized protein n=1 Tax=Cladophialophora chaetospira TaxID=386627 RepID=A0AA38X751_9EURO|nr:hypothetical protein H2200_007075 [Cladophialophora chaetospira]